MRRVGLAEIVIEKLAEFFKQRLFIITGQGFIKTNFHDQKTSQGFLLGSAEKLWQPHVSSTSRRIRRRHGVIAVAVPTFSQIAKPLHSCENFENTSSAATFGESEILRSFGAKTTEKQNYRELNCLRSFVGQFDFWGRTTRAGRTQSARSFAEIHRDDFFKSGLRSFVDHPLESKDCLKTHAQGARFTRAKTWRAARRLESLA